MSKIKGRGAQNQVLNRFKKQEVELDAINKPTTVTTQIFYDEAKAIVNKVNSPDLGFQYSMNPYQGCEHGCAYCYARSSHEYWGFNAGLDFESKIIVKRNAAPLLEKKLNSPSWTPSPISMSGNTDCYQPIEKKLQLTRKCLAVFLKYKHPVAIITKNALIKRDIDILSKLAKDNLVHVHLSLTTLNQSLKSILEPRTSAVASVLNTIEELSSHGIPVNVMMAPIIPGINESEIGEIVKQTALKGARSIAYTTVRLNGSVIPVFEEWLQVHFPDRYAKVINKIKTLHQGQVSAYAFGKRMKGTGPESDSIAQLFSIMRKKYYKSSKLPPFSLTAFIKGGNLRLF